MKKDDLNKKQRYALDTMLSGSNVFLTGDAGTGKTTVIHFNSQPHEEADGNFRQKYIYLKLFFTLIAHINLVFYSNHYIVNFFLVKYTHFLVRMS